MTKPITLAGLFCLLACASSPTPSPDAAVNPAAPAEAAATGAEPAQPGEAALTRCPEQAGICFEVEPDDAELKINDDELGTVRGLAANNIVFVSLEPGIHLVTLRREGYSTWRSEVTVGPVAETMKVTLEPDE